MHTLSAFVAKDRQIAIANGNSLRAPMYGSVLFADISGYTRVVNTVQAGLGKRGAEEMTSLINKIFDPMISHVQSQNGIIVGFGGDGITCWFAHDNGLRAIICGLAIQQTMKGFTYKEIPTIEPIKLSVKIVIATGYACRFAVGVPEIQLFDLLAGEVMTRLAEIQPCAETAQVITDSSTATQLVSRIEWKSCQHQDSGQRYARIYAAKSDIMSSPETSCVESSGSEVSDLQLRPWVLLPVYEWLARGSGDFLAEIRPVTVLLLRFSGIVYDKGTEAESKLNEFLCFVQQTVSHYHGFVIKVTIDDKGSYAMCTFGTPLAYEAQMRLSLAAALELRTAASEFPFIHHIQIGLAEGELLAGAFGNENRAAYDLLGRAANLAARLMMQAQPGQILMTADIASKTSVYYESRFLGKKELKGCGEVDIYELLQPLQLTVETFGHRLVGRGREQSHLRQWQKQALRGTGQTIQIEGVAGVGKSHLRANFVQQCIEAGFAVAQSICSITDSMTPYAPWQSILFSLLGLTHSKQSTNGDYESDRSLQEWIRTRMLAINPEWEARLPILYDVLQLKTTETIETEEYTSSQRQEYFFALVIDLIRSCVQQQPLLLVIEDAHWIDEASLLLTLAVDRMVSGMAMLLLLTHRPIEPEHDYHSLFTELGGASKASVLHLHKLSPAALRVLARQHLSGNVSRLLLSLLRVVTQGNPLYILELLDRLREQQEIVLDTKTQYWTLSADRFAMLERGQCLRIEPASGEWLVDSEAPLAALDWEIPATLDAAVRARIDHLPTPQKLTVKIASVIGHVFETDILSKTYEDKIDGDQMQHHLDWLIQWNYIEPQTTAQQSTYAFSHHILQEVTYDSLLEEQKAGLHRDVGRALESLHIEEVERLAYHYGKTSDKRKALFYLDKAAQKAQRAHANRTALTYYQRALALGKRWEWLKGMVEVLHVLGRHEEEHSHLQELATLRGVPEFDLMYLWGEYYLAVSEHDKAEDIFQQALRVVENQGELILEIRCLNKLGWLAWKNGGRYEQAEQKYKQALTEIDGWEKYEAREAETLIDTLNSLGTLCRQQGLFEGAEHHYQRALALSQTFKNRRLEARTLDNLGSLAYHQRKFDAAMPYHQAAQRLCRIIGDRALEVISLYNQTLICREQGDLKHCYEHLIAVQEIHQALGNRWEVVNLANELGILFYELGSLAQAQSVLEDGLRVANQINDMEGRAYLLSNLGLILRDQFKITEALTVLQEGLDFMRAKGNQQQVAFFCSYIATTYLQASKMAEAAANANEAIHIRQQLNLRPRMADDLATLALIQLIQPAISGALVCADQVEKIMRECDGKGVEFPQRAWFVCYQVFQAAGDKPRAQDALQMAYDLVQSRVKTLDNPEWRHSFLNQVAVNRAIVETVELSKGTAT